MTDKSLTKLAASMYKKERKQIEKNLSNFVQPNQSINCLKIIKNKSYNSSEIPTYTKDRLDNLKNVDLIN